MGDPTRLRQIVLNLIGNAIKFTSEGQVITRVKTVAEADQSLQIRIEIEDSGIGISPEGQRRIFESFSQEDGSTTRRFGGTGLGLSICRQLVELMNGHIDVDSEQGKGSTFWFEVSLKKSHKPLTEVAPHVDMQDINVLVVDDNAVNLTIYQKLLNSWHIPVSVSSSGKEAVAMLLQASDIGRPFDLVLLDCMMPDMDGIQVLEHIRCQNNIAATKVIILSSTNDDGTRDTARKLGIQHVLTKPVRSSTLLDSMITTLSLSESFDAPANESDKAVTPQEKPDSGFKILVAEDNTVNQKVTLGILKKLGYSAEIAADGVEAIEMCGKSRYDLIFMDCHMPNIDGYAATEAIRKSGKNCNTPIIAMTANAMQGDREKCLNAGMDDYVSKPIRPNTVSAALDIWLKQNTGQVTPSKEAQA